MRYAVLGPVEVSRDDVVVPIGGPQIRRLLALLLSRAGQSISVDLLVDCLWPDGLAPERASRSVMSYVSRLRRVLGEGAIATTNEGYRLDLDGATADSQQFEALLAEAGTAEPGRAVEVYNRALGLWRGAAYGEFGTEWWLLGEANRLNEIRVVAMEERAEASLAIGHHHRVIPELERLALEHPLRERPVSLLMQALGATGRNADSIRAFHSFRSRLADETGLEPSAELIAYERALASGNPVRNPSSRAKLLRGYVVHEVLGEGAFGRVFAATQPGTHREVAIKAIRPEFSDSAEFIQRFEAEAQLVARLEHPHIVPLYDYWREPGAAYLVFRLLLGGTALASMVNHGPFSVARASRLVEEVGSGLLAAHTAGVVHCDIKPSNVIFDEMGNSYLSDFGIAVTSLPLANRCERSRTYPAPELAGRTGDTVQSDIFSFGCMIWELLAGAAPAFRTSSRSRLPSLAGTIAEPSELLDAVLGRATSVDADARFQTMAELIVAWRDAVGRPEGVLTPMGPRSNGQIDSSRRRAVQSLSLEASTAVNPYKGLRAFTEADASDFFGRDHVISALHETLAARGFVVVVGPSGSGKSSLVNAGLVPLLRHGGARVATMVPGDRPTAALGEALRQVAATAPQSREPSELLAEVAADGSGPIVLVVDQFEECWTLADPTERERFLGAIATADQFGVRCVTTVRADLYDRPLQHASIGQMVADGTFALPPLSAQELEDVVMRPAERNGVDFDDGVVTAIVAEARAQPAGLPLLQFAMADLYERRVDNRVTATALQQLGGLGGAVGLRAEQIYISLDDDLQAHTRQLFGRLVAPGHDAPDTRRRARLGELTELDRVVADRFVAARLLVADRDSSTREPVFEVAHEALLTNWSRLREWLQADRRWLAQLQHLVTATRAWNDADRADSELYRGSRLEGAIEALPEHGERLTSGEHEFISTSRELRDAGREREKLRSRRLRRLLIATACFLAVALLAGVIAFAQRQHAQAAATRAEAAQRSAEIEALVGRSMSIRTAQRDTAALLAVEAFRLADTPRTRSALLSTFTSDVGFLGTERLSDSFGGRVQGIVLPDGQTALVTGTDQRIRSYDLDSGAAGDTWPALMDPDGDSRFVSSADGRLVAQVHWYDDWQSVHRSVLGVFDTATHTPVLGPILIPFVVDNALFSPDDALVYVSGDRTGTTIAYSISDSREVARLSGPTPPDDSPLIATTAGLAFVAGGELAVGSVAGPIRLVDPLTLDERRTIVAPRGTTEHLVAISDGNTLVGSGLYGRVRVNVADDTDGPTWTVGLSEQTFDKCEHFTVAEKLGRFYCASSVGRLEEHDLESGGFIRELNAQNGAAAVGSYWLARDQTELVNFNSYETLVARWRLDGSGPVSRRLGAGAAPDDYSPDGRQILALLGLEREEGPTGWVLIDSQTGERIDGADTIRDPFWLADGTIAGWSGPEDAPTLSTFDPHTKRVQTGNVTLGQRPDWWFRSQHRFWLHFTSNDNTDGTNGGEIWTIDLDTKSRIEPTIHVDSLTFGSGSESGDRVAVNTDKGLVVFDGNTGEPIHTFVDIVGGGTSFLPGNRLVAITPDGKMTIYDLASFEPLTTLGGLPGWGGIWGSRDGSLAMLGGYNSVILYDPSTGEQIGDPITIPDTETVSRALRPDGQEMAIGGGVGHQFVVWDLDPEHWVTAACKVAGRNLTTEQWTTNIGHLAEYHSTCPEYD